MLTKNSPISQRVPASLFLSCPVDPALAWCCITQLDAAGVHLQEAKGTCGCTIPGAAHGSSCGLVGRTGVKDSSPLLCIFCSVFKITTHREADKAGLLPGIVRAVIISHCSINQPTDQHHFPPALEAASANRHPLATGTGPGDPQPGLPVMRDRFGQTTVLSQGTVPWRLQSKQCLHSSWAAAPRMGVCTSRLCYKLCGKQTPFCSCSPKHQQPFQRQPNTTDHLLPDLGCQHLPPHPEPTSPLWILIFKYHLPRKLRQDA